jgi:hypothetical protein
MKCIRTTYKGWLAGDVCQILLEMHCIPIPKMIELIYGQPIMSKITASAYFDEFEKSGFGTFIWV